jgi:tetratricopeptide (TPR) repeat protein
LTQAAAAPGTPAGIAKRVAIDREDILKKAEKLLRQGRLDAAIAEYQRVVDEYPRDWNAANALGDCYARAHQTDKAVEQYLRIADHFAHEGFHSKAAALYKKALKLKPHDEHALAQSAEVAIRQGILIEAKQFLATLAERREARGDLRGAGEVLLRMGALDPDDVQARLRAARAAAAAGKTGLAVTELRSVAEQLSEAGRADAALEVLEEAGRIAPDDTDIRTRIVAAWAAGGDLGRARTHASTAADFRSLADAIEARDPDGALELLGEAFAREPADRETAARLVKGWAARGDHARAQQYVGPLADAEGDGDLAALVGELQARAGRLADARQTLARVLAREPHRTAALADRGAALAPADEAAAFALMEAAAESQAARGEFAAAVATWRRFTGVHAEHVPALMRLVESAVDASLPEEMTFAQSRLADVYLSTGRGAEAQVLAEDLVTRFPEDREHAERLRRALTLVGEPDVEGAVAERIRAAAALTAADSGLDLAEGTSVPEPTGSTPVPAAETDSALPSAPPRDPFGLSPIAIDLRDILGEDLDGESAAKGEGDEVDLSDSLKELKARASPPDSSGPGGVPASLDEVFREFRTEVARQSQTDVAEQRYKVALAYREMGMVTEAMKELEMAVRLPRLRFEAASLLARLSLERGQLKDAVEWFERAAEAPAPTVESGRALLYDLADALESGGETARALAVFLELQADAADYRDVTRRVERLSRAETGSGG